MRCRSASLPIAPYVTRDGEEPKRYMEYVSDLLMPIDYLKFKSGELKEYRHQTWDDHDSPVSVLAIEGYAKIQDLSRLPKCYRSIHSGPHFNSHTFLVDDFVRAVVDNKLPPNNAWDAARFMIPGLIAHESALRGGELLDIPDLGDAPADFERLTYKKKEHYEQE